MTVPQQLSQLDSDRFNRYRTLLKFYQGDQWLNTPYSQTTVSAPWVETEKEPRYPWLRRLTLNYAKVLVDKITAYTMSGFKYAVDPTDGTREAQDLARRAEDALARVYETNHLAGLDFDTEIDTAILGDGCYKVTWDPAVKQVRITAPDVQGIYAWWIGDDPSRLWKVASKYVLTAEEAEMLHGYITTKATVALIEVWTAKTFELWIDNSPIQQSVNPYGFIPYVIYPNIREPKQFWGASDIPPIMQPTRELNRAMSQLSRILELSGNPITVLEGVDRADDITVEPGQIWELPEKSKAYLLDLLQGGGVRLHIEYIDALYRSIHDLSESPRTAFGDNQKALSGVALEMELHPLLQKVRRKRLIRTVAYQKRNEMILRLLTKFREGPSFPGRTILPSEADLTKIRSRIVWGEVLPQDRARTVENETRLVEKGIHSRKRAADNLGIDNPEEEFDRWLEEQQRIEALSQQGEKG